MRTRMPYDDVAGERSKVVEDAWVRSFFKEETLMEIGKFICRRRQGNPVELCDAKRRPFNVSFLMRNSRMEGRL